MVASIKLMQEFEYRILAIDDNPQTLEILERALGKAGFDISTAASGSMGLKMIQRHGLPHLALVDIHMPGMDGFEFAREIHKFCDLPIIMLTAVDTEETIIEAIDEFAEDYVVKPFSPGELVARVRRVLRRVGDFGYTEGSLVKVDDWLQVDFPSRILVVGGKEKSLTPTESKLLYILLRHVGQTVTINFLLRRLWPLETAYEDRLRVHVHRLRKKFERDGEFYIASERGQGYRFVKVVS
jgi:DNA-binding response OmpR family regulator